MHPFFENSRHFESFAFRELPFSVRFFATTSMFCEMLIFNWFCCWALPKLKNCRFHIIWAILLRSWRRRIECNWLEVPKDNYWCALLSDNLIFQYRWIKQHICLMCLASSWEYLVSLVLFGSHCMPSKFLNAVFKKFLFWMWLTGLLHRFATVISLRFSDTSLLVLARASFDHVSA